MRSWEFFVINVALCVVFLANLAPTRSDIDIAQGFLTSLEIAAESIARSATTNYEDTCGQLEYCRSAQNCSKRECYALHGQELSCVFIYNFTPCNAQPDSQCERVNVNFHRSMIRLPGNGNVTFPDDETKQAAFAQSVCAQRTLDATFAATKFFSKTNETFYFNLYFATADGAFRVYPAREVLNYRCNTLEPRIRPWYIGAISVVKDVVIILDTGATMTKGHFISGVSSLDTALNLTRSIAFTLAEGDTLNILAVNSTDSFEVGHLADTSGNITQIAESLAPLLASLNTDDSDPLEASPTLFDTAFARANVTSGRDALKVIIAFTNSDDGNIPPSDLVSSTLADIKAAGTGLFLYDFSQGTSSSPWGNTVCDPPLDSVAAQQNPFLYLNAYYSFLARARIQAANGTAMSFWSKPYVSQSDLGRVTTVSFPAMSSDNTVLVGVVGIDVQTGGLSSQLETDLENLLDSEAYNAKTSISTISRFVDPVATCSTGFTKSCPDIETKTLQPFCSSPAGTPAEDSELLKFLCCSGAGCSCSGGQTSPLWTIGIIVPGGLVYFAALVWASIILYRKYCTERPVGDSSAVPEIPFRELWVATKRFDPDGIIARGERGVLYEGVLAGTGEEAREEVVVKQLNHRLDYDIRPHLSLIMRITRHSNFVELKGICFHKGICYLVYKRVQGRDLYQWLWPTRNGAQERAEDGIVNQMFLTWENRMKIAQGVATGLNHLHTAGLQEVGSQIVQLDLKLSNILVLNSDFSPKICNFGISQLYDPGQAVSIATLQRRGQFEHMAPEGQSTTPDSRANVYCFGVMLFQLVSGRKIDDGEPSFVAWARRLAHEGDWEMMIHEHVRNSVCAGSESRLRNQCRGMIDIATRCTEMDPGSRPEMAEVLRDLARLAVDP